MSSDRDDAGARVVGGVRVAATAWVRALELTAPIPKNPDRALSTVIDELAEKVGEVPALRCAAEPCGCDKDLGARRGPRPVLAYGARGRSTRGRQAGREWAAGADHRGSGALRLHLGHDGAAQGRQRQSLPPHAMESLVCRADG